MNDIVMAIADSPIGPGPYHAGAIQESFTCWRAHVFGYPLGAGLDPVFGLIFVLFEIVGRDICRKRAGDDRPDVDIALLEMLNGFAAFGAYDRLLRAGL